MWKFHLERVVVKCGLEGLLGSGKLEGSRQPVTDGEGRRGLSSWFQQPPPHQPRSQRHHLHSQFRSIQEILLPIGDG